MKRNLFIKNINVKKIILAIIMQVVFLTFLFLPVYRSNAADKKTVTVAMHKNKEIMEPYIKRFMKEHPDIKIEYTCYSDYESTMKLLMEDNNLPDVFFVPGCISSDDYTKYLEPIGKVDTLKEKYNYLEKGAQKNGTLYGIPSFAYLHGFIYNKEVFEKAGISQIPKSPEDFLQACQQIKEHTDAIPFYTAYDDRWTIGYWAIYPFIEMTGSNRYKYTDYLTQPYPFSEGSTHYTVYKLLYDLIKLGYTDDMENSTYGQAVSGIKSGKIACISMGSWAVKEIQGKEDLLGFMPFPNNIDGQQYITVTIDYCYGISSKSDVKDEARLFVDFMLDESGYAYNSGNISILKTDLYPDFMNDLSDVVFMYDSYNGGLNYDLMTQLKQYVDPDSEDAIATIMEAAAGIRIQSFDEIMFNWNTKWEMGRPEGTATDTQEVNTDNQIVNTTNSELHLSEKELKYIEEHEVLKVGYYRYAAPFSFENNKEFAGLAYGICTKLEEMTGLSFEYIGYDTESEIIDALNAGDIDMIAATYEVKNRNLKLSKSYFEVLDVYVVNKDADTSNIDDCLLAVPEGMISKPQSESKTVTCPNKKTCFDIVEKGDADYLLTNYYIAEYYISEQLYTELNIRPFSTYSTVHMAFTENQDNNILAIVNKCLYTIKSQDIQTMLLDYATPKNKRITLKSIMITNPILFISIILATVGVIIVSLTIVLIQRAIGSRRIKFENDKYKALGKLSDEYLFDYDVTTGKFIFDIKFVETFGFPERYKLNEKDNTEGELKVFFDNLKKAIETADGKTEPFILEKNNGEKIWYKFIVSFMYDEDNNPIYAVGKMANVQAEMENVKTYQEKAEKDELTKINNRRGFYDELIPEAKKVLFAVLDVDSFKSVNDTLGHAGGDEVLCIVARQLEETFGEKAILGRYGGDEFMVALIDVELKQAKELLEEIVTKLDRTVTYDDMTMSISVSIGAVYSRNNILVHSMFGMTDKVLYEKKNKGKNGYLLKLSEDCENLVIN